MDAGQITQCIEAYKKLRPRYQELACFLTQILEQAVKKYAPFSLVQSRVKTVGSFAEKLQRKGNMYDDPLMDVTDLCGSRVITVMSEEIPSICKFIENHFDIDWENSLDISHRLKPSEFGYRSIHYIVQFKRGIFPSKDITITIPESVFPEACNRAPMKAEIQVRTILEHAWAVFTHDRTYKRAFAIPSSWNRELAGVAAMLEEADRVFSRINDRLKAYSANYGISMTQGQLAEEICILESVLETDPGNAELAYRISTLAMAMGDWGKAVQVLSPYENSEYMPIRKNLGVALCKLYGDEAGYEAAYLCGQHYLREAAAPQQRDPDALAKLASTYKDVDDKKAKSLYRQACEIDPIDPYPLQNYLMYEIIERKDISLVSLVSCAINASIERCREHADVGINVPWVYFSMGNFLLLQNKTYESLAAYAKAIDCSLHEWMIETNIRFLEKLAVIKEQLAGYEWALRLLLLGSAAKFQSPDAAQRVRKLAQGGHEVIKRPIVIIAGEGNHSTPPIVADYRHLLISAFDNFTGTVISGGTTSGVSGLAGDLQEAFPDRVTTIGYVPESIKESPLQDNRYRHIRYTAGKDFSAFEPLQYWIEIAAAGIPVDQVKVLGIGGGIIAAFEYRMALALGAEVALLEGSGNEAARLITDSDWFSCRRLLSIPRDAMTLRAFIGMGISKFSQDVREILAQSIHENYRIERTIEGYSQDPAMANWDKLRQDLKESNRQQADHMYDKLHKIGYTMQEAKGQTIKIVQFTQEEVELLAEMEHGRWIVERLREGWKWGKEKDTANRVSPYLVAWSKLPENVKEWDRQAVRKIPELLAKVGIEVIKN